MSQQNLDKSELKVVWVERFKLVIGVRRTWSEGCHGEEGFHRSLERMHSVRCEAVKRAVCGMSVGYTPDSEVRNAHWPWTFRRGEVAPRGILAAPSGSAKLLPLK